MSPPRPAAFPFLLSLGLHAALAWFLLREGGIPGLRSHEPIQISYFEVQKKPATAETPATAVLKKKIPGIPIPRLPVQEEAAPAKTAEPVPAAEPTDFQKNMDAKLKKQQGILAKLGAEDPVSLEAEKERPKTSAEMMADPQKGKLYVSYFGEMKKQIQKTLSGRFARRYSGKGSVTLRFIVNAQGYLEKVSVSPKDAKEDEMLRDLAVQCLREAAPFGSFPPELGSKRLVFDVTFFFDGRN